MSGFVTAAIAVAVIGTGTAISAHQATDQRKAIKNAAADADAANKKAIADAQAAEASAEAQAKAQVDERRKRASNNSTIFTSPLGLQEQASVAKKKLLGS